jgi:hypothetical protein
LFSVGFRASGTSSARCCAAGLAPQTYAAGRATWARVAFGRLILLLLLILLVLLIRLVGVVRFVGVVRLVELVRLVIR